MRQEGRRIVVVGWVEDDGGAIIVAGWDGSEVPVLLGPRGLVALPTGPRKRQRRKPETSPD
jgi:hypothetical protein